MYSKGLAKLANIACQTLLFVSVSLAMDNQRTSLLRREQCLAGNVGQFRQAFTCQRIEKIVDLVIEQIDVLA